MPWRRVLRMLSGEKEPRHDVERLERRVTENERLIQDTRMQLARLDERVELFAELNRQRVAEEAR